jgi:NADH-quinone oxidoreductase subunit J
MEQLTIYLACAIAASGLYLVLAAPGAGTKRHRGLRMVGAVVALGAIAFLFAWLLRLAEGIAGDTGGDQPGVLFYVFAIVTLSAAARMITHPRPVYSALYFVLVVISSAAVFLLLEAEFMAFALVIVYAGAILITYLFVLMLAQQAPNPGEGAEGTAEYDRIAREPAAGVFVGFLLVALLSQAIFDSARPEVAAAGLPLEEMDSTERALVDEINLMKGSRGALVERFQRADADLPIESRIGAIRDDGVEFITPPGDRLRFISWAEAGVAESERARFLPQNIERVGLALVHKFPVSLELAGVILLMAMFGAVVLARKQIELSEDEKREAAGIRRLTTEPVESHVESAPGTVRAATRPARPLEADSGGGA